MTFDSTQLQFKQRAVPNPPVNPVQSPEPGVVTMPDGSQRRVTLEIQVNGVWKKIDPNQMKNGCFLEIAKRCQEIYQTTTQETGQPETLTVYFEQKNLPESWTSASLGRVLPFLKDEVVDLTFKKVEYKTADSDELHVVEEKTHAFDTVKVNQLASSMTWLSKGIFGNREYFLEKTKKIKKQPVGHVTQSMNQAISDAGSTENRCASLSLAKRELALLTPAQIIDKYDLPNDLLLSLTNEPNSEVKIQLLSEALIEKAAHNIATSPAFRDPYITLQNQPCLAAIERALNEHKLSDVDFEIPVTPEEKVAAYASLMRQPNFMLDLPFFLALDQPFIILRKDDKNDFMIDVIGHHYTIPSTIENCDLKDVNIVYYNGTNHYQSVVLSKDAQKEAMRTLLRREINGQIEGFISRLRTDDQPQTLLSESADMVKLLHFYHLAKIEIIDRFKREYPNKIVLIENLINSSDDVFAVHLREVIHDNPVPIIEDLVESLVQAPMEKTLSQIQTLISDTQRTRAAKVDEFKKLVGDIVNSDEGRLKIIRMLPALSTHEEDNLLLLPDARFILEATNAFQNPGPVNHGR